MARLNEPPIAPQPSTDSIEALKRRFLRQNRELAKTNSIQSIRIRSLETDCSRLLAENLALREQVLNLHNTIESRPALDQIDVVKTQLEAKLSELGSLVAGLSQSRGGYEKDAGRRKSQMTAKRKSGEERQWRSGLGLQEVENGMLPTITEDKYYPRRTMGYVFIAVLEIACADAHEANLSQCRRASAGFRRPGQPITRHRSSTSCAIRRRRSHWF